MPRSDESEGQVIEERSALWMALQRLTNGYGVYREDLLEALKDDEDLGLLRQCWNINVNNGLEVAQRTIIANVHAHLNRITPRRSSQKNISGVARERQYQQAAKVSFNAVRHPDYDVLQGMDLTRRREWLEKEAPRYRIKVSTGQRDLTHAIDQIEAQILASGYQPVVPQVEQEEEPELQQQIDPDGSRSSRRTLIAISSAVVLALAVTSLVYVTTRPSHDDNKAAANPKPSHTASVTTTTAMPVRLPVGTINATSASAPVRAVSVAEHELPGATSWAWPTPKHFGTTDLDHAYTLPDPTSYTNWYVSRGGTPTDGRSDLMTLVGNAKHTVTILNAEASKRCSAPMSGTLVRSPNGGEENNTGLYFDLDQPQSIAQEMREHEMVPDYFGRHTYTLKPDEQATFNILTTTEKFNCTYVITLTVLDGTKKITEQVSDNGRPFALTASIAKDHIPVLSKYKAVYLGGTESPMLNGKFKQVNPATCDYLALNKC